MEEHSTMRVRRRRRGHHYAPVAQQPLAPTARPKRRRWLLWLALLCIGLWLAPVIVAKSPLSNMLLRWALADVRGSAQMQSVSLGWFSPLMVDGFELRDTAGEPLMAIERVFVEKQLIRWLLDRRDLGLIRLETPRGRLEFANDTTNIEAALGAWLSGDSDDSGSLFDSLEGAGIRSFDVQLVDGSLVCVDRQSARRCTFANLNGTAKLISPAEGIKGRVRADCEQDQLVSRVEANLELVPARRAALSNAENRATLETDAFPVWLAGSALRRFVPGLELDGQLVSNVDCQWQAEEQRISQATVKADCSARSLYVTATALQGDQVRLAEARMPIDLSWRDGQLHVTQAALDSELGQVAFAGTLDPTHGWIDSLRRKPYQLTGRLDVARLAAMMPHTIHVRDDTRITAGMIDLVLNADAKHEGLVWQGKLETSQLAATSNGQSFSWERPVLLTFQAHESADGLVVDRLYGEADFLELQGEGTATDGHLSASFDLERLSSELSRFFDLGELRLDGDGSAYLAWQRRENGVFEANSQVEVHHFELTQSSQLPWLEDHLEWVADLTGQMEDNTLQRIKRASMRMAAGGDVLTARLQQPVMNPLEGGLWSVALAMRGDLEQWSPRLRPWMASLADYQIAGDCDLSADLVYAAGRIDLEPVAATVREFRFAGAGMNIQQPQVELSASGQWDWDDEHIELSHVRFASQALVAEGKDLMIVVDPQRAGELKGNLRYTGDVAQLWGWTEEPGSPSDWQLAGRLNGELDVRRAGGVVRANLDSTIEQFQARLDGAQAWQEPQLRLVSRLEHDGARQLLKLEELSVVGQALRCTAQGSLSDLAGRPELALDGRLRYDLAQLQPLWQQWVGNGVQLEGVDERPFSIRGPLGIGTRNGARPIERLVEVQRGVSATRADQPGDWLAQMQANAELHWDRGNVYGFNLGPGDLRTRLANGVLNVDPIDVSASQGRLRLAPVVRMSPGPMELYLQPGRAADRIQITPEMCDRGLKFVAPVLAGVTQAQGQFSVDIDGCRVPLAAPSTADVAGKMRVHAVEIGPGPLVQELTVLLNRAAPARITRESIVEFRMVNGRVYHKGLELAFPEFTVRTHGSVGMDESLAILAEMPVPPKWIGNNRVGDALRNQTIQLPIGGTLRAPRIDQQALQQTSARFIRDAASGAVQRELFRQIDRVLGPVTQ